MSYKEPLKALEDYREKCKLGLKEIDKIVAEHESMINQQKRRAKEIESIIVSLEKGIELLKKEA